MAAYGAGAAGMAGGAMGLVSTMFWGAPATYEVAGWGMASCPATTYWRPATTLASPVWTVLCPTTPYSTLFWTTGGPAA